MDSISCIFLAIAGILALVNKSLQSYECVYDFVLYYQYRLAGLQAEGCNTVDQIT